VLLLVQSLDYNVDKAVNPRRGCDDYGRQESA